jgi:hypothetical protein
MKHSQEVKSKKDLWKVKINAAELMMIVLEIIMDKIIAVVSIYCIPGSLHLMLFAFNIQESCKVDIMSIVYSKLHAEK